MEPCNVLVPDLVTRFTLPPGLRPDFRRGLSLQAEFGNRVDRQRNAGDVLDTALIHRRNVVPPVVVVRPVNLPVDLIAARSVDGAEAAQRVSGKPGRHADQLGEVASVQRNILHRRFWNHRSSASVVVVSSASPDAFTSTVSPAAAMLSFTGSV
jgi:hypothetical protein